MPKLTGLHLLLTYQCTYECDHCFVWSSPRTRETLPARDVREILRQASEPGTVRWIWFEGGEPLLFHASLLDAARRARDAGFQVGLVSNAYWAISREDAELALEPFVGLVDRISISSDLYHADELMSRQATLAVEAARALGIEADVISIAQPEEAGAEKSTGQVPAGLSAVMFRGRAAAELAPRVEARPWRSFDRCPHEDLRDPGRVHVDPPGEVHLCQGISLGNLKQKPLARIWDEYDPDFHPVIGPLLRGGPAELVREYDLPHEESYADACHLCYEARRALRPRFPEILCPDQVYGPAEGA